MPAGRGGRGRIGPRAPPTVESGRPQEPPTRRAPPGQAARTGDALDPALVGTWEGLIQTPQGPTRVTYVISPDGTYSAVSQRVSGSGSVRGRVRTQDGRVSFVNQEGRRSEAAYRVVGRILQLQTDGGAIQLERRR